PGPQAVTLRADRFYLLPSLLFRVTYVDRTVVPQGTIGVVVARAGAPPAPEQSLCRHVGGGLVQGGPAVLLRGGRVGRQVGSVPGGEYDINPLLFEVITVDTIGAGRYDLTADDLREISIPVGTTGVVVTRVGAAPSDEASGSVGQVVPGHASFQLPWVFLDN